PASDGGKRGLVGDEQVPFGLVLVERTGFWSGEVDLVARLRAERPVGGQAVVVADHVDVEGVRLPVPGTDGVVAGELEDPRVPGEAVRFLGADVRQGFRGRWD